jgi:hypothetical protein
VVLELGTVASAEACCEVMHGNIDALLLVGVENLELDHLSLQLSHAPWLHDVDHLNALLLKLHHLVSLDGWGV